MLSPDLQPNFLKEQQCKENATRQLLSFITLPEEEEGSAPRAEHAPDEICFPYDALTEDAFGEGAELFNWKSRNIYDVDGLLLFRDLTLDLDSEHQWHVRTAASDLLQTPVRELCDYEASALSDKTLIETALNALRSHSDLEPFVVDEEEGVRLVAYSYPNIGILCYSPSNPDKRFVFKLGEPLVIPVAPRKPPEHPESLTTVWSPYDLVGHHTVAHFRRLWEQNLAQLPQLPESREKLRAAIKEVHKLNPPQYIVKPPVALKPQESENTCAVASALMLLRHHGIDPEKFQKPVTYSQIAAKMKCDPNGADPKDQEIEVNRLLGLAGSPLKAELDIVPLFEKAQAEISKNRPFKFGVPGHARVAVGFKVEAGGQNWLKIFNPIPVTQGKKCWEAWTQGTNQDFMYVRP